MHATEAANLPIPQKIRPRNSGAKVFMADDWQIAPMMKEEPAITMDLCRTTSHFEQMLVKSHGLQRCQIRSKRLDARLMPSNTPFATPMLCEIGSRYRGQTSGKVHEGGISLQRLVVVFAIEAAAARLGEKPSGKLSHGLDTTCICLLLLGLLRSTHATHVKCRYQPCHATLYAVRSRSNNVRPPTSSTAIVSKQNSSTCSNNASKHHVGCRLGINIYHTSCCTLDVSCRPDLRRRYILLSSLHVSDAWPVDRLLHCGREDQ